MNFVGSGRGSATRSPTWAANGMVCCSQPLAAGAGIEMLKAGGSAVDAAIATNACLGLMEPTACGLGGDLYAILWDPKDSKLSGLNASGRAPFASAIDKIQPTRTARSRCIRSTRGRRPGAVDGWFALHARFGRRRWSSCSRRRSATPSRFSGLR